MRNKLEKQDWNGLEVKIVNEGKGVFASKDFKKHQPICNYGGIFMNYSYIWTLLNSSFLLLDSLSPG